MGEEEKEGIGDEEGIDLKRRRGEGKNRRGRNRSEEGRIEEYSIRYNSIVYV